MGVINSVNPDILWQTVPENIGGRRNVEGSKSVACHGPLAPAIVKNSHETAVIPAFQQRGMRKDPK